MDGTNFTAIPRIPALCESEPERDGRGNITAPGQVYVNTAKNSVKPYFSFLSTYPITLTANQQVTFQLQMPAEENNLGDGEIFEILSEHTGRYSLQFYSLDADRNLQSQPIHVGACAGTGQLPFRLFESLFVQAGSAVQVTLTNLESSTITINGPVFVCRRFLSYVGAGGLSKEEVLQQFAGRHTHPYWLGLNPTPTVLTAGGNRQFVQFDQLTGEADLEVSHIMAVSDGPFRIQFFEGQQGRPINSVAATGLPAAAGLPSSIFCGTALLPRRLPDTWLVKRGTKVTAFVDELSGLANNLYLYLHGRLLYDDEAGQGSVRTIPIPYVERPFGLYGSAVPRR